MAGARRASDNEVVRRKVSARHALYVRDNRNRMRHITVIDVDRLIPRVVSANAFDFDTEVARCGVHSSIRVSDTAE
jgi:hypothetical protein